MIVFGVIRKMSPGKFQATYGSFFSDRTFRQHLKEEFFIKNYSTFFLGLAAAFALAISISLLREQDILIQTTLTAIFVLAFVIIKVLSIYALSKIISSQEIGLKNIYIYEILFLIIGGMGATLFLPTEVFLSFKSSEGLFVSLLLLLYAIKLVKQFLYSIERKTSLLYIILYFCAFEIIPALTLLKFLGLI